MLASLVSPISRAFHTRPVPATRELSHIGTYTPESHDISVIKILQRTSDNLHGRFTDCKHTIELHSYIRKITTLHIFTSTCNAC
jgi:hypothetical protein